MKALKSLLTAVFIFLSFSYALSQTTYSLSEGIKTAKSSGKKIFVEIYSLNDNWSKKMESEVYTSSKIQSALSDFVFVKINADASDKITYGGKEYTSSELSKALGATGYPTFVFMNSDGSVIKFKYNGEEENNISGFLGEDDFSELLQFFAQDKFKSSDLSTIFNN